MKNIRQRITQALGDLRPVDLSRRTGISLSSISRYFKDRDPSLEFVMAACKALDVSAQWLLFGEGPMRRGQIDWSAVPYEQLQHEAFRRRLELEKGVEALIEGAKAAGDASQGRDGRAGVQTAVGQRRHVPEPSEPTFRVVDAEHLPAGWMGHYVPMIGRIAAGIGVDTTEAESYPAGLAAHYLEVSGAPRNAFAVQIEGDSMEPQFRHGDVVIVDGGQPGTPGNICAVLEKTRAGDRIARIKRLVLRGHRAMLCSLNAKHKPIEVLAKDVESFVIWKHLPSDRSPATEK